MSWSEVPRDRVHGRGAILPLLPLETPPNGCVPSLRALREARAAARRARLRSFLHGLTRATPES
jgi:hypothetical protein